ncbi:ABC transporter ATP-binding protein [Frigoribacterium salinisoli]
MSTTTAPAAARALPVTLSGVGRSFGRDVLRGVDLAIEPGEIVAVLGPSGCGKSTLLRQVAGLDSPDAGAVEIAGSRAVHADQRCAVAFQEPRLLPWRTLRGNVALGLPKGTDKAEGARRVDELLELVGLTAAADRRPRDVSGGMAQRASLARALAREPRVLLLDEPFGALDALTRLRMQDLLLDVHAAVPTTVVLVTHDVDEALYLADRVVLLADLAHADLTEGAGGATSVDRIARVPGARPRDRDAPELAVLRQELLAGLGVERHARRASPTH